MKLINLLSIVGNAAGAFPGAGGFVVEVPWGEYQLGNITLKGGWYELRAECQGVVLRLYDRKRFSIIDMQAKSGGPAYVRLSEGQYDMTLLPGARPGRHEIALAEFRVLPLWRRLNLLAGRLFHAINTGVSLSRILKFVRLAVSRQTYGLRAAPDMGSETVLGVLTSADLRRDKACNLAGDYSRRLNLVKAGPCFLITEKHGRPLPLSVIKTQVYQRYTIDPEAPHDFVVVVANGDILTPDALLLFAEHILRHPKARIIVADKWISGVPTARIAWDPLLYNEQLPTVFAYRRGQSPVADFKNRHDFSIIGLAVASTETADQYVEQQFMPPADRPPATIVIPTRDRAELLKTCLQGLFENTNWPHEVIIVDNGSVEPETFALFDAYISNGLRVVRDDGPFNFSRLCNLGAGVARTEYLVFLNNDVIVDDKKWLEKLMTFAALPHAGAVGARLVYADGSLQHGGVMLGLTQLCGHLWRTLPRDLQATVPQITCSSLRSAVTAACLCVRRSLFESVGGFDADLFPVTLNDVDLCLKIQAAGYFNIYCASAEAFHLEGVSRGDDLSPEKQIRRMHELEAFEWKWGNAPDPWMSRGVTRAMEKAVFL